MQTMGLTFVDRIGATFTSVTNGLTDKAPALPTAAAAALTGMDVVA